ncbi:MAG: cytochrome c oxidase subunit [Actinomycetota bacterium]|nr:cytochrome c oxidase subunit [Actinomycetota bacterium]
MTTTETTEVVHGAGEHGAHPSESRYIIIALVLGVLTAIEVAVSYAHRLGSAANPLLLVLAATKFALVAMFFMHLKFDNKVLRRFFVTGIILAAAVYVAVMFTLGVLAF